MDLVALLDELQKDPQSLGYSDWIAKGSDATLVKLLNARTTTASRRVPLGELFELAIKIGLYPTLRGATLDPATPIPLAAVCFTLLDMINSPHLTDVNLNTPAAIAMMDALQGAGILKDAERQAIVAAANTAASRAEVLFGLGAVVLVDDVALALRPPQADK